MTRHGSRGTQRGIVALLIVVALAGCADSSEGSTSEHAALGIGSKGADVETLHSYLKATGYLPNEALAEQYPDWEPVVEVAPTDRGRFDQHTERAVRQLQLDNGLKVTGRLDDPTRALLEKPRCGVPENTDSKVRVRRNGEKFALDGGRWNRTSLTWRIMNKPSDVNSNLRTDHTSLVAELFTIAAARWSNTTGLTFRRIDRDRPDIEIRFADLVDSVPGLDVVADASFPNAGGDIRVDVLNRDVNNRLVAASFADVGALARVLTHELGHALGLHHSSVPICVPNSPGRCTDTAPIMQAIVPGTDALSDDDKVAISTLYDTYLEDGACTTDIAVGAGGTLMRLGCEAEPGGGRLYVKAPSPGGWGVVPGVHGVALAVDPAGSPWVVDDAGFVWRGRPSGGGFSFTKAKLRGDLDACAIDIAIGPGNEIWIASCDLLLPWGVKLRQFNPELTAFDEPLEGGCMNVSVGKDGLPWCTNVLGSIYRRTPFATWEELPGSATEVAVGPFNNAYAVGTDGALYSWSEQPREMYPAPAASDRIVCSRDSDCSKFNTTCSMGRCLSPESAPSRRKWERLNFSPNITFTHVSANAFGTYFVRSLPGGGIPTYPSK